MYINVNVVPFACIHPSRTHILNMSREETALVKTRVMIAAPPLLVYPRSLLKPVRVRGSFMGVYKIVGGLQGILIDHDTVVSFMDTVDGTLYAGSWLWFTRERWRYFLLDAVEFTPWMRLYNALSSDELEPAKILLIHRPPGFDDASYTVEGDLRLLAEEVHEDLGTIAAFLVEGEYSAVYRVAGRVYRLPVDGAMGACPGRMASMLKTQLGMAKCPREWVASRIASIPPYGIREYIASIRYAACKYGVSTVSLEIYMSRIYGIHRSGRGKLSEAVEDAIVRAYIRGEKVVDIMERYGVNASQLYSILAKWGVKLRRQPFRLAGNNAEGGIGVK